MTIFEKKRLDNYKSLVELLIQDELKGTPRHEFLLLLGSTPKFLIEQAGFPDLPLAIVTKTISKACFEHGIPASMLKRLPEIINNPKSLYKSANAHQVDSVVVLTFEFKAQCPVIVPIQKDRQIGRKDKYNLVTSVYGKEGECAETKWQKQGLLLWQP